MYWKVWVRKSIHGSCKGWYKLSVITLGYLAELMFNESILTYNCNSFCNLNTLDRNMKTKKSVIQEKETTKMRLFKTDFWLEGNCTL